MKALRWIIYSVLLAAVIALLCYQGFVTKELEGGNLTKGLLLLAGILLSMFRPARRRVSNKKALYQKAFGEFLQNAFSDDKKLEKQLYNAVHDYNMSKPAAAVAKLDKLRKECRNTTEMYAVTVFMGLSYDDMCLYKDAAAQYEAALQIRQNSTLYSNLGLCRQRYGDLEGAQKAYEEAIRVDPHNACAYNNLSSLYFRDAAYHDALEYAELAIKEDAKMVQALSTAAICCALLGETEDYERYYRQAVANGYDGQKIKNAIRNLDTHY